MQSNRGCLFMVHNSQIKVLQGSWKTYIDHIDWLAQQCSCAVRQGRCKTCKSLGHPAKLNISCLESLPIYTSSHKSCTMCRSRS